MLEVAEYAAEFGALARTLAASLRMFLVFLAFVMLVVPVMVTLMYEVEGRRTASAASRWASTGRARR